MPCAYESDGEDEANVFNVSGSIRKGTKKHSENLFIKSYKFLFILFNNDSFLWQTAEEMLRTKIRQTGGIRVDKMLNTNHIFNKLKRKKYFAALALVSAAAVVLFRHFQNFDLIVEDKDIGDLPAWWFLSPLWYCFFT